MRIFPTLISVFIISGIFVAPVFASSTNGTIDTTYKYAWGENLGWINFGLSQGNVQITDSGLTGYGWSENYGWINLNPSTSGVKIDSTGNLSGYAWGENLGWINFNGVAVNSSGEFTGYATASSTNSRISFNCSNGNSCALSNFKVKTDYISQNSRPAAAVVTAASTQIFVAAAYPVTVISPITPVVVAPTSAIPSPPAPAKEVSGLIPKIIEFLTPEFLKPKPPLPQIQKPLAEIVPPKAPLSLKGKWELLPAEAIGSFVLAPLPSELKMLASQIPQLRETFKEVGVNKITDVGKLVGISLKLPGLTEAVGLPQKGVLAERIALPQGVPLAKLPLAVKEKLPSDIIFTKSGGGLVDFNNVLTLSANGILQQKITTVVGKPLELVIKPDTKVKRVRGFLVFKSKKGASVKEDKGDTAAAEFNLNSLLGSLIFNAPSLKQNYNLKEIEERLVLQEFEFIRDGNGLYTAQISAPVVDGEYEIIAVMDYENIHLASKEIRLITAVDPEGYVYENYDGKEIRIPDAIVTLFWLNPLTKKYEIWPAKDFQQENPQITDIRGTYSFLVPEGGYYIKVEAPGYLAYEGKPFNVKADKGVHFNIELKTADWWLKVIDWKTIVLVALSLLILYNFYKDKLREKKIINQ